MASTRSTATQKNVTIPICVLAKLNEVLNHPSHCGFSPLPGRKPIMPPNSRNLVQHIAFVDYSAPDPGSIVTVVELTR